MGVKLSAGGGMGGEQRAVTAAAVLLALIIAGSVALAENDTAPGTNPPPSANQPSAKQPSANQPIPEVTVLGGHEVEGILGRTVLSATNEDMGRIVDVLVDHHGQARAVIIDFGGFLGVGSRKIAVDWNALHFPAPGKPDGHVTLELNRDQVKAAPAYQEGKPVVVLGALGKLEPLPE
jgi:hypothetical protein